MYMYMICIFKYIYNSFMIIYFISIFPIFASNFHSKIKFQMCILFIFKSIIQKFICDLKNERREFHTNIKVENIACNISSDPI